MPTRLTDSSRNMVRASLMGLATAAFGAVALAISLFDRNGRWQHRVARAWAATTLAIAGCPMTVVGAHNLPLTPTRRHSRKPNPTQYKSKPAIYACNHLSYMDTPAIFASLRFQFRILAKSSLFTIPFMGWYLRRSGQVSVDSTDTHSGLKSLNTGVRTLKSGLPLVVFPEGARSLDGELHEFLSGMAFMAVRAGVPIVPMALVGTYACLPMHVYHIAPKPFLLVIGKPIDAKEYTLRELDGLTATVFAAIQELYSSHSEQAA